MDGRDFLTTASELVQGASEAHWRAAAGRAYYAAMLEARDTLNRWGIRLRPRDNVHSFVRLRFVYARDKGLKTIGTNLEYLGRLRNDADYHIETPGDFADSGEALNVIDKATKLITLLDQIDQDPRRRAAAIAAL